MSSQINKRTIAFILLSYFFGCTSVLAASENPSETLRSLVRVKIIQTYTEMGYGVYLRNCKKENPEIESIIASHRAKNAALVQRLDALIGKYRAKVHKELNEKVANADLAVIAEEEQKTLAMMRDSINRDEKSRRFECVQGPKKLPDFPLEVEARIKQLESE